MTNIMTSQTHLNNAPPLQTPNNNGAAVKLNSKQRNIVLSNHLANSVDLQQRSRSLNKNVRQREMARITEENETLLRRLQEKTSQYNVEEWEADRKKQVKMLKKICYYPPSLVKKHRLRSKGRHNHLRGVDPNYEVY